jgi:hypothetical protein
VTLNLQVFQDYKQVVSPLQQFVLQRDPRAFSAVPSQTSDADRVALLELQNYRAISRGTYVYVETGSFLGGTLAPHCVETRCRKIYSIDARTVLTPNEHGGAFSNYGRQTSADMLRRLQDIPCANIEKVTTFDSDAREVPAASITDPVDFLLIDGEHTDEAVVSDFNQCYRHCQRQAVIAFHDYSCIRRGVSQILLVLNKQRIRAHGVRLGGDVFAVFLGDVAGFDSEYLRYHWNRRHLWTLREGIRARLPSCCRNAIRWLLTRKPRQTP